ncbi:hypothetical protein SUDANB106_05397 [Streptomyces sp. enrichment culture]|nr:hypothetical protein LUW77_29455 [Streptomyces radiopugnans]
MHDLRGARPAPLADFLHEHGEPAEPDSLEAAYLRLTAGAVRYRTKKEV